MTTLKPLGGKMVGIYPTMPEDEYKGYLKVARSKGITVEDYFLEAARKLYHEQAQG
jgi:hypothetical protein